MSHREAAADPRSASSRTPTVNVLHTVRLVKENTEGADAGTPTVFARNGDTSSASDVAFVSK